MMMFQWNAEEARKVQEEERQEDILEAESRGKTEEKTTIIRNMLNTTSLSYDQIAQIANTTVDEVSRIAKDANIHH